MHVIENRLLAVDDNGFVSNYWYDADGERTVKTTGESDQLYVNGVFSGGTTITAKFSLYVIPYLVPISEIDKLSMKRFLCANKLT